MLTESEFVNSLHVQQRKCYWKLKQSARESAIREAATICDTEKNFNGRGEGFKLGCEFSKAAILNLLQPK